MPTPKFAKFSDEISSAWKLFVRHWETLVKLALFPLAPMLFMVPYLLDIAPTLAMGETLSFRGITLFFFIIAIIAAVTAFVAGEISKTGIYVVLNTEEEINFRDAFHKGTDNALRFFWTEVITLIFLGVAASPLLVLRFFVMSGALGSLNTVVSGLIVLVLAIVFVVPLLMIGTWLVFAPLSAAIGDSVGGLHALTLSTTIIRPSFWRLFKRLVMWAVGVLAISTMVTGIAVAHWVVPFVMALLSSSLLLILYKETKTTPKPSEKKLVRTVTKRVARIKTKPAATEIEL